MKTHSIQKRDGGVRYLKRLISRLEEREERQELKHLVEKSLREARINMRYAAAYRLPAVIDLDALSEANCEILIEELAK